MQLTGCHNVNKMRNATCADTQISIEWPYCSFLYCGLMPFITWFFSQENACDFLTAGVASNSSTFPGFVFRWVVRLLLFQHLSQLLHFLFRELRDHGLTRPKVLIVVPFRDSALKIVEILTKLLMAPGEVRNGNRAVR